MIQGTTYSVQMGPSFFRVDKLVSLTKGSALALLVLCTPRYLSIEHMAFTLQVLLVLILYPCIWEGNLLASLIKRYKKTMDPCDKAYSNILLRVSIGGTICFDAAGFEMYQLEYHQIFYQFFPIQVFLLLWLLNFALI